MTARLLPIIAVVVMLHTAINAARPMASFHALSLGASIEQLGLMAVAFAGISVLVAIPFGRAVDRWGAKPFAIGACATVAGGTLVLWLAESLVFVFIAQPLIGVGQICAAIAMQTFVAGAGPADRSDSRFGSFAAAVSFAQFSGPAVAGLLAEFARANGLARPGDIYGATFVFPIAAAMASVAAVLAIRLRNTPRSQLAERTGPDNALREVAGVVRQRGMASALLVSMVVFGTTELLTVFLPAYGSAVGWSVGYVTLLLSVRAAASFALRLGFTPALRLLGRRGLLVAGCISAAASAALIPFVGGTALPIALIVVYGFAVGAGQPLTMAWVARAAPPGLRSTGLGVRLTSHQVWTIVGSPIVALLVTGFGPAMLFIAMAALLAGSVVPAIRAPLTDPGTGPTLVE